MDLVDRRGSPTSAPRRSEGRRRRSAAWLAPLKEAGGFVFFFCFWCVWFLVFCFVFFFLGGGREDSALFCLFIFWGGDGKTQFFVVFLFFGGGVREGGKDSVQLPPFKWVVCRWFGTGDLKPWFLRAKGQC